MYKKLHCGENFMHDPSHNSLQNLFYRIFNTSKVIPFLDVENKNDIFVRVFVQGLFLPTPEKASEKPNNTIWSTKHLKQLNKKIRILLLLKKHFFSNFYLKRILQASEVATFKYVENLPRYVWKPQSITRQFKHFQNLSPSQLNNLELRFWLCAPKIYRYRK